MLPATRPSIEWASGTGTPRWRSTKLPIAGPSLSRKKRLRAVNERKTANEASLSTPPITPWVSASNPAPIEALASAFAFAAVVAFTPRSPRSDSISLAPSLSLAERLSAWLAIPVRTISPTPAPTAMIARKTSPAPIPLGTPCRRSQSTSGEVTEAMIPATITGSTIVSVSARSQIAPTSAAATPTKSQAVKPRSRSQVGAEKTPLSSAGSSSTNSPPAPSLSRPGRRNRPRIARLGLIGTPDDTRRPRHGHSRAAG